MHWERSEAIANEIRKLIPINKKMTALEYGAGTGITSFLLKDDLKEITLMDSSTEMVKIMKEKIKVNNVKNMKAFKFDLEHKNYTKEKFDLIFTQMVLHHIADITTIIRRFGQLLNPGGYLTIADLYSEDGSFHGEGFSGHKGFDVDKLSHLIRKEHFTSIYHNRCYVIDRKISETETQQFPVFLLIARYKGKNTI